jgi:23S rRNA (cytidine1920-2'-O)/16S rRNA (cytidine1409-2'-O)-methyltransferase
VVNIEKCNARYLTGDMLGEEFLIHGGADVIVMDVSFISQTYILPALVPLLKEGGHIVSLIKPQFELDKKSIGKGGVVKDAAARRGAVTRVLGAAGELGLLSEGVICSPIRGGDGNVEYLTVLHAASAEEQESLQLQITKGADALPKHLFIEIKDRK